MITFVSGVNIAEFLEIIQEEISQPFIFHTVNYEPHILKATCQSWTRCTSGESFKEHPVDEQKWLQHKIV